MAAGALPRMCQRESKREPDRYARPPRRRGMLRPHSGGVHKNLPRFGRVYSTHLGSGVRCLSSCKPQESSSKRSLTACPTAARKYTDILFNIQISFSWGVCGEKVPEFQSTRGISRRRFSGTGWVPLITAPRNLQTFATMQFAKIYDDSAGNGSLDAVATPPFRCPSVGCGRGHRPRIQRNRRGTLNAS